MRWLAPLIAALLLGSWLLSPSDGVPAGPLTGESRTVDGDTLQVGGHRIRLAGIDAPERLQTCTDAAGQPWPCGRAAGALLEDLRRHGPVRCTPLEQDRYGRVVATCEAAGVDLGGAIVAAGLAVPDGRYASAAREAQAARRGIWAGTFEQPAAWRQAHSGEGEPAGQPSRIAAFLNWVGNVFAR